MSLGNFFTTLKCSVKEGVDDSESQDSNGYQQQLAVIRARHFERAVHSAVGTTIYAIDKPSDEASPEQSDSDVARIVDAQIEPCVTVD